MLAHEPAERGEVGNNGALVELKTQFTELDLLME